MDLLRQVRRRGAFKPIWTRKGLKLFITLERFSYAPDFTSQHLRQSQICPGDCLHFSSCKLSWSYTYLNHRHADNTAVFNDHRFLIRSLSCTPVWSLGEVTITGKIEQVLWKTFLRFEKKKPRGDLNSRSPLFWSKKKLPIIRTHMYEF